MRMLMLASAYSYLLGSIPFGYILVRTFRGEDVRLLGSGNTGATNVSRSSPSLGLLTLVLDASKGGLAVALTRHFCPGSTLLPVVAAVLAILGHILPVWLKFRGGKGVATGLGSFLLLAPKAILIVIGIFVVIVLLSRHVSLASIVSVGSFPPLAGWLDGYRNSAASLALMAAAAMLIIFEHRANLVRLWSGTEPAIAWRRR
jgi:glycerol-3-phosphate acyltransferase PlsY